MARENNLQSVDVDIPERQLSVFTGVSGSGKSSLVLGTIAAESRRLIDETCEAFVQGFMPPAPQPDADSLEGLTAAILVGQDQVGASSPSRPDRHPAPAMLWRPPTTRFGVSGSAPCARPVDAGGARGGSRTGRHLASRITDWSRCVSVPLP